MVGEHTDVLSAVHWKLGDDMAWSTTMDRDCEVKQSAEVGRVQIAIMDHDREVGQVQIVTVGGSLARRLPWGRRQGRFKGWI